MLDHQRYLDKVNLLSLLVTAFGLSSCGDKQALREDCPLISGTLPAWAKTDLFEIQAKLPENSPISRSYTIRQIRNGDARQLDLMLQVLLEDKFHLKVHQETRDLTVWALTVAKGGPKLKQTGAPGQTSALDGTSVESHGFRGVMSDPATHKTRLSFQAGSMQQVADIMATLR